MTRQDVLFELGCRMLQIETLAEERGLQLHEESLIELDEYTSLLVREQKAGKVMTEYQLAILVDLIREFETKTLESKKV